MAEGGGKPDGRRALALAMAHKVVAGRENAKRVKRPGKARPLRPPRQLSPPRDRRSL